MDTATRIGVGRGLPDRSSLTLGVADLAVLAALIVFGQRSHDISPVTDPVASLETIVPFAIGWIVASSLVGLYGRGITTSVPRVARLTAVSWLAAANVGFILRASPAFAGGAPWTFTVVMTGTGLVALVGWRVIYATYANRSE
ncbi:DUF3054 domain-containing protein [Halobiforma nitratireducens]|uniref:DUF3054 domain-containing protein n=1 Tax=Halobiforma nitratireducens JCM 10879 TaxID=1227454 RepID=M0L1B9_9EURY|nr:DUF3054 domain-containing protein [Halobiforma nitratireducens]EMA27357.1 hypothetical protein C446_18151 [Halobiforma nitratireducens JCM 10879]